MTNDQFILRLLGALGASDSQVAIATFIPTAIEYAEQRIYRDLDLISCVIRDSSSTATANSRTFTLPSASGRFVVLDGINVYTPVSSTTTRNPVRPVSRDFVDVAWPTETAASATTIPKIFAMITDQIIIFGPPPGAAFTVEVIGRIRPTALSASNTTTFLSNYLPDLMLAAACVWGATYLAGNGVPLRVPVEVFETGYRTLLASADAESVRRRFAAASQRG